MAENVIIINFDVESEAYQAFSDLKRSAVSPEFLISEACILKNENGRIVDKDFFDTGVESKDDTRRGGIVGSLMGVLGGPLGVILCGGMGYLLGRTKDVVDIEKNASLIEQVCQQIPEGTTAIVALAWDEKSTSIDSKVNKFPCQITKLDAAEVEEEVEKAREIQRQMEKDARKQLREERKEAAKQKIEERRAKIKEDFEKRKAKFAK